MFILLITLLVIEEVEDIDCLMGCLPCWLAGAALHLELVTYNDRK